MSWEDNPDIGFVMMKGSGRAFCAGGDVVRLHQLISEGEWLGPAWFIIIVSLFRTPASGSEPQRLPCLYYC
jgi:enoyl-CoA hydratase/carnithine racemase